MDSPALRNWMQPQNLPGARAHSASRHRRGLLSFQVPTMRCCMRMSFVNLWIVIYGLGIVWHDQPLIVFPAVLAALVAHGVHCWTMPLVTYGFSGGARYAQRIVVGGVLVAAIVGLAGASTGVIHKTDGEHLRDGPLAAFFLLLAILAWRAVVRPEPRRTSAISVFIYMTWLPVVVWNA